MLVFPGADIAAAMGGGVETRTVTASGAVLFARRERPILVPRTDLRRQRDALAFFGNSPSRRVAGEASLWFGRWLGLGFPTVTVLLPAAWEERFGVDLTSASIYCGSSGPLQKITIRLPPLQADRTAVVVKVALRASADEAVAREAANLRWLSSKGLGVISHVPHLLDAGYMTSGRRYLATVAMAQAGRVASVKLSCRHADFLTSLARVSRIDVPWQSGPAMSRSTKRLEALASKASQRSACTILGAALRQVANQLQSRHIPHTMSHGDFTRFNIRDSGKQFVIFDWEYAQNAANPLADILHYAVAQRDDRTALAGFKMAVETSTQFAASTFEGWSPNRQDIKALAVHALVDTLLSYAVVDGCFNEHSFIVRRFLRLIEDREAWGASCR